MSNIKRRNIIFDSSFQRPTGYTPCSTDQCENAQTDEPPHTPPFPPSPSPSRTPAPHRYQTPVYSQHGQETATARNTRAQRHRFALTALCLAHSYFTLHSLQWLAIGHSLIPIQ